VHERFNYSLFCVVWDRFQRGRHGWKWVLLMGPVGSKSIGVHGIEGR
jgi:hypothetical protein